MVAFVIFQLRHIREQMSIRDHKVKDLEEDLKRLRRESEKQEARHYHEQKEWRAVEKKLLVASTIRVIWEKKKQKYVNIQKIL